VATRFIILWQRSREPILSRLQRPIAANEGLGLVIWRQRGILRLKLLCKTVCGNLATSRDGISR